MDLKEELGKAIKGEVKNDSITLDTYSKDASVFEIRPQAVVFPRNSSDIKALVKFVNSRPDQNLSLTARSAGTCMSGGAINDSIIVDMTKYFNQMGEVKNDSVSTQPGVYYRVFDKQTRKKGLILPCYTASREINTVGGMVGNNSAGEKTLSYGQTEKYVKRLKVILSDGREYTIKPLDRGELKQKMAQNDFEGRLYKHLYYLIISNLELIKKAKPPTTKNSAGYYLWGVWDGKTFDLTKLITGSQGTLGIVTEIQFTLVRPKPVSNLLVIFLNSLDDLGDIINQILSHHPETLESFDDQTLKIATRFIGEIFKVINPSSMLNLAWQFLPEMWMSLTGGLPKLILLAEFTGESIQEVNQQILDTQADLKKFHLKTHITQSEAEQKKYWTIRRESFNLLRHHSAKKRTAPFIDDLVVRHDDLPTFLPQLKKIMDQYGDKMVYTIAGHVGDGNLHIIPLVDLTDPKIRQILPELGQKVYDLVFQYHGSMTGEHNDGLVRGFYLKQMYGRQVFDLFKEVKQLFDPKDIFNPHKKVDATLEYTYQHLAQPHPDIKHSS